MADWKPIPKRKTPVKESVGERGKYAEGKVKELFEKFNTQYATFAFERMLDARAARGGTKKAISDFMVWNLPHCIPLEVKSTEHDFRLPSKAIDQLPRLRKVAMAGAKSYVLVYFKKIDAWRIAPVSWFESGVPSWDMRSLPTFPSAEQALFSTGFFPRLRDEK